MFRLRGKRTFSLEFFPVGLRLLPLLACAFIAILVLANSARAGDALRTGAFRVDPPTLHSASFRWYIEGDDDGDASCAVYYRKQGGEEWRDALPLLRINREEVDRDFEHYGENAGRYAVGNLLAGSILFLEPDCAYEVRLALVDPDGGSGSQQVVLRTRKEPRAPEPSRVLHLYPADFSGAMESPSFTSPPRAFAALAPGTELRVHAGEHVGGLSLSLRGSEVAPIVIRAAGDGAAVFSVDAGNNFDLSNTAHVFVEGLVLRGGRMGLLAQNARHLVVRGCLIEEVRYGIYNGLAASENWYIADNILTGTDGHWEPRTQEDAAETGIAVYGRGHVVEYNRISRFWDALTVADFGRPPGGVEGIDRHCVAIDFNNNDLFNTRDDLLEVDFASHNVRVWNNQLFNSHTGISAQPLYGGPVYFVSNVIYSVNGSTYKFHNWPAGIYAFHNTSVGRAVAFSSAPLWQNATLLNNLFLGAGDGYTMESGSPDPRTHLDYNGWSRNNEDPQRFIKFTNDGTLSGAASFRFGSLREYYRGTGNGEHSLIVSPAIFAGAAYPEHGVDYSGELVDLRLQPRAVAIDAGVFLPNITRKVTGERPDLGAYEWGVRVPHYGPR